jgi:hypothetical protein
MTVMPAWLPDKSERQSEKKDFPIPSRFSTGLSRQTGKARLGDRRKHPFKLMYLRAQPAPFHSIKGDTCHPGLAAFSLNKTRSSWISGPWDHPVKVARSLLKGMSVFQVLNYSIKGTQS